jgi:outer membrane protein assembly factor BamB
VFFSRAAWIDRLGVLALMIAGLFATRFFLHESIATGGMGMLFPILAVPLLSIAFVASVVASRGFTVPGRRLTIAATILLACGGWTLVRTGGIAGNFDNDFAWRWAQTPEERLVAQQGADKLLEPARGESKTPPAPVAVEPPNEASAPARVDAPAAAAAAPAATRSEAADPISAEAGRDWPGFRGSQRDGIVRGVRIETDWSTRPPVALWRRPVGPGWSSFSVRGNLLYTQEQRGEEEVVAAYDLKTGTPVWRHSDRTRFWEANGGAGPRGTPTLSGGRVYSLGATGIVNALDARDGAVVWSRNAASDTGATVPIWGFSGSPLVIDDLVIVAASGALVAYDLAGGTPRWFGPIGNEGYSSPHLLTIDGVPQVLMLSGTGISSVVPADGTRLWEHQWRGYPIVQPAQTAEGDILISVTDSSGTRRLAAARGTDGWTVEERWTSNGLKPYFNDFVVHEGHAYGFDGRILACIDLKDGTRKWKGGRYGGGQLVLLRDQNLLLVLSEEGEVALVGATTDQFREIARYQAIEGKTWNHPVVVGDLLLVRNAEEMAAFRLAVAGR